jgi:hypothetical protein
MQLFFGRKPKVTPKDSIVELRNTLQMLEKRETFLQTKIDNELKIAKANATKNRRGTTQRVAQATLASYPLTEWKSEWRTAMAHSPACAKRC